jgi:hypothetical protein
MRIYGIPASITLAQGILESGDGLSKLAREANNHFGIKCHDWTGDRIYHDDDEKGECFRKYRHAEESYRDHSEFLRNRQRYSELFSYDPKDYKSWAHGLKKAGYATSPTYATTLIKIIEENQLHLFDLQAMESTASAEQRIVRLPNGAKFILLGKGETIEDVAALYKRNVKKLLKYNDLTYESVATENSRIFIKPKKCRGSHKIYKVREGETMHSISQQEGIKLRWLYKRNQKNVGWQPKKGDELKLKGFLN